MRRQTRGQMHRSPVGHRRQQISKFLMLSLSERALSSPSDVEMWQTHAAFLPVRPPTVPACLPDEHNPPPSPASLHLDLTKEGGIHAAEKFLSFSLSLSLSLCPVAQSECGGRIVRAHLSTPPSLPLSDPFGKNARARVRLLLTLAQD